MDPGGRIVGCTIQVAGPEHQVVGYIITATVLITLMLLIFLTYVYWLYKDKQDDYLRRRVEVLEERNERLEQLLRIGKEPVL